MFNLELVKFWGQKIKNNLFFKKNLEFIRLSVLLVLLLIIYFRAFCIPPRSDFWHMFYFFHHLDQFPGPVKWLHVINYDLFEQMRYQPIPPFLFYLYHLVFGANFILFTNLINFIFYFLSLLLVHRFISVFCKNRGLIFIFITLLSLFFSHSDMLFWSYHSYLFLSFSLFIWAFIGYIDFLKTGSIKLLYFVFGLMFLGMISYEPFFFWPLAIIILAWLNSFKSEKSCPKAVIVRLNTLFLTLIYSVYFLGYLFTRSLGTYRYQSHGVYEFITIANIIKSFFAALFSIAYTNIFVNIFPFLAFPLSVRENVDLGGGAIRLIESAPEVVFMGGLLLFVLSASIAFYLIKKKCYEDLKIAGLFTFLSCSFIFIVFLGRLITNDVSYVLKQFRYQYIPNVFVVLLVILIFDRLAKSIRAKQIKYFLLVFVFISNVFCITKLDFLYRDQFFGLRKVLTNIQSAMRKKDVNPSKKLYLDPDLPDYFPVLCWNIEIGERFIPVGNYQWVFSPKELGYFTSNLENAFWFIDKNDFDIIRYIPGQVAIIDKKIKLSALESDKAYMFVGKDRLYMETAWVYKSQQQYLKAIEMFTKAISFNPGNHDAYTELADVYQLTQRYSEAQKALNKADELGLDNN